MITMEMLGKILRMFLRDKLSLHEMTKRTGLARNTTRRWRRKRLPRGIAGEKAQNYQTSSVIRSRACRIVAERTGRHPIPAFERL